MACPCTSLQEGLVDVFGDLKAFFAIHQGAALVGRHQTFFLRRRHERLLAHAVS
jgi:hypothetical protein